MNFKMPFRLLMILGISLITVFQACKKDEEPVDETPSQTSSDFFKIGSDEYDPFSISCQMNGQYLGVGATSFTSSDTAGCGVTTDGAPAQTSTYVLSPTVIHSDTATIYITQVTKGKYWVSQSGNVTLTLEGENIIYEFTDIPAKDEDGNDAVMSGKLTCAAP